MPDLALYEYPLSAYALKRKIVHFSHEHRDYRPEWMIRSSEIDVVLEGIKDETIRFSNEFK